MVSTTLFERGDGGLGVASPMRVITICSSATTRLSVRATSSTDSPGSMRQFTTARAVWGNAFSACPADTIGATQVVRSMEREPYSSSVIEVPKASVSVQRELRIRQVLGRFHEPSDSVLCRLLVPSDHHDQLAIRNESFLPETNEDRHHRPVFA